MSQTFFKMSAAQTAAKMKLTTPRVLVLKLEARLPTTAQASTTLIKN